MGRNGDKVTEDTPPPVWGIGAQTLLPWGTDKKPPAFGGVQTQPPNVMGSRGTVSGMEVAGECHCLCSPHTLIVQTVAAPDMMEVAFQPPFKQCQRFSRSPRWHRAMNTWIHPVCTPSNTSDPASNGPGWQPHRRTLVHYQPSQSPRHM